jgi:hypothetical protein
MKEYYALIDCMIVGIDDQDATDVEVNMLKQ